MLFKPEMKEHSNKLSISRVGEDIWFLKQRVEFAGASHGKFHLLLCLVSLDLLDVALCIDFHMR